MIGFKTPDTFLYRQLNNSDKPIRIALYDYLLKHPSNNMYATNVVIHSTSLTVNELRDEYARYMMERIGDKYELEPVDEKLGLDEKRKIETRNFNKRDRVISDLINLTGHPIGFYSTLVKEEDKDTQHNPFLFGRGSGSIVNTLKNENTFTTKGNSIAIRILDLTGSYYDDVKGSTELDPFTFTALKYLTRESNTRNRVDTSYDYNSGYVSRFKSGLFIGVPKNFDKVQFEELKGIVRHTIATKKEFEEAKEIYKSGIYSWIDYQNNSKVMADETLTKERFLKLLTNGTDIAIVPNDDIYHELLDAVCSLALVHQVEGGDIEYGSLHKELNFLKFEYSAEYGCSVFVMNDDLDNGPFENLAIESDILTVLNSIVGGEKLSRIFFSAAKPSKTIEGFRHILDTMKWDNFYADSILIFEPTGYRFREITLWKGKQVSLSDEVQEWKENNIHALTSFRNSEASEELITDYVKKRRRKFEHVVDRPSILDEEDTGTGEFSLTEQINVMQEFVDKHKETTKIAKAAEIVKELSDEAKA